MFAPPVAKQKTKSGEFSRAPVAQQRHGQPALSQVQLLQRRIGNQALLRLFAQRGNEPGAPGNMVRLQGVLQAKLRIGSVNDPLEHEADRVADQVMRMPAPVFAPASAPPQVSRKCAECEEEGHLQKKEAGTAEAAAGHAPASVHEVLRAPGQPLDAATRGFMEPRFGQDFSGVRVFTGASAEQSARDVNANAYTVGQNMVFDAGRFAPGTREGRRLLAHELTHVVQQSGDIAAPATTLARQSDVQKEDPNVTALKAELVATFGLSAVTDTPKTKWTVPQLEKMKRALARIPAAERGAIKGVELRRVATTTEFGSIAAGLFQPEIAPGTGIRQDRIEISNKAFESDEDYDAGGAYTTFGGQVVQGAPSEGDLSHEVGHAVESVQRRTAEETRVKADLADTAAFNTLKKATDAYDAAILTSIHVPAWSNAKEKNYSNAILDAQKKLDAISKVMNKIPETPTAAEVKKGATNVKSALDTAKKAITARNKARAALPANSTFAMANAEAAQDTWLAAAVAAVPAFEARAKTQEEVEKAHDAPATQITITVSSGQKVQMTRRLAEFVAVIEANNIDIANSHLGDHVTSHWPNNPEEAYAELYSLSVTAPDGLKKFDKQSAVATYFTSPVGLKGAQKKQAKSWLARHQ